MGRRDLERRRASKTTSVPGGGARGDSSSSSSTIPQHSLPVAVISPISHEESILPADMPDATDIDGVDPGAIRRGSDGRVSLRYCYNSCLMLPASFKTDRFNSLLIAAEQKVRNHGHARP